MGDNWVIGLSSACSCSWDCRWWAHYFRDTSLPFICSTLSTTISSWKASYKRSLKTVSLCDVIQAVTHNGKSLWRHTGCRFTQNFKSLWRHANRRSEYSENSISDHLSSVGHSLIRPVLYSVDWFSHFLPCKYQQALWDDQLFHSELRAVVSDPITLPPQYDHLTSAICAHLRLAFYIPPLYTPRDGVDEQGTVTRRSLDMEYEHV